MQKAHILLNKNKLIGLHVQTLYSLFDKDMKDEIVLYQPNETIQMEVRLHDETVWLNRNQLAILFDRDIKTIGKHINNALKEELSPTVAKFAIVPSNEDPVVAKNATTEMTSTSKIQYDNPTVAKFAIVQKEGNREVVRHIEYYSLDVILSVGYRVKSTRGIEFRRWANRVLKEYLLRGYVVNQRIEKLEQRMAQTEQKIDFFVRTSLPPVEGIFYEGEIFDAYAFTSNLIRRASHRIILIDNYIDDSVLAMLDKRTNGVSAIIYTKKISKTLALDIQRHNEQYAPISVLEFGLSHDRFMIIDDEVYHIGASLKDLGKKWFAFSKMSDIKAEELINHIQ